MFNAMKTLIESKNYRLDELKERLNSLTAHGDLTPEERGELMQMADAGHDPLKGMDMKQTVVNHEQRIKALEAKIDELMQQSGGETVTPDSGEADEYPPYHAPTGAHDYDWHGDKMTYTDGKRYECIAGEGVPCVYPPDVVPGMWKCID